MKTVNNLCSIPNVILTITQKLCPVTIISGKDVCISKGPKIPERKKYYMGNMLTFKYI